MTVATIGIIIILFSTSAQAASTTVRPIDDYAGEYINFMGIEFEGSFSAWADPESGLAIYPHAIMWVPPLDPGNPMDSNFLFWGYKLLKDCPRHGIITEREIDDELVLITINLHVKEVPFLIFPLTGVFYHNEPNYAGEMSYNFELKVVFNKAMLDEFFEQMDRLPSIAEIAYLFPTIYPPDLLPVIHFVRFTGNGYITEGGEGRVVVNQVGILDAKSGELVWPKDITIVVP